MVVVGVVWGGVGGTCLIEFRVVGIVVLGKQRPSDGLTVEQKENGSTCPVEALNPSRYLQMMVMVVKSSAIC